MRAQQLVALDGPDGMRLVDVPPPDDPSRVLIDVRAAGVSFPELLTTYGRYQEQPPLPFVPGIDVAGVVAYAPADAGVAVGDRVCAVPLAGGWAEQAAASPHLTFPLHPSLDFAEGAALVVNYQTAYFCIAVRGRIAAGERLLVHGAAGGLGTAGIQVGRGLGAQVIAVVSTPEKAEVAAAAGAHEVVLLRDGWLADVRERAGGGVDVVFDVVGGDDLFVDSLRCLVPAGRLVVAGFAAGEIPKVRVNRLLLTNTEVVGAAWGAWVEHRPESPRAVSPVLDGLIGEGVIRPVVGARFGLADVAEALRTLERREAVGKVVLEL